MGPRGATLAAWTVALALVPLLFALAVPLGALELAYQEAWLQQAAGRSSAEWWLSSLRLEVQVDLLTMAPTEFYRPLALGSQLVDWLLAPQRAWSTRFTNLLLSGASCALLARVLMRTLPPNRRGLLFVLGLWWWHPAWVASHLSVFGRPDLLVTFGASLFLWSCLGDDSTRADPSGRWTRRWARGLLQLLAGFILSFSHEWGAVGAVALGVWVALRGRLGSGASLLVGAGLVGMGAFALSRHVALLGQLPRPAQFAAEVASLFWGLHQTALVPWLSAETCPAPAAGGADAVSVGLGLAVLSGEVALLAVFRGGRGARWGGLILALALGETTIAVALGQSMGRWGVCWPLAGLAFLSWLARLQDASWTERVRALRRWHPSVRGTLLVVVIFALFGQAAARTALGYQPQSYWSLQHTRCSEKARLAIPLARSEARAGRQLLAMTRLRCAWQAAVAQKDERTAALALLELLELIRAMTPPRFAELNRAQARFIGAILDGRQARLSYGSFTLTFGAEPVEHRAVESLRSRFLLLQAEALAESFDSNAVPAAMHAAQGCPRCRMVARRASRVALRLGAFESAREIMQRADLVDSSYFGFRSFGAFIREARALHLAATAGANQYLFLNYDLLVGNVTRAFRRIQAYPQLVASLDRDRRVALAEVAYSAGFSEWTGRLIRGVLSGREQAEFLGKMAVETERALPPTGDRLPLLSIDGCVELDR